ncbi:MAG: PAS domain S-box protein [Chloroflexota bacterium]
MCEGANYLAVCDETVGPDAVYAKAIAGGIRAAILGEKEFSSFEYPCDAFNQSIHLKRWFNAKITRSISHSTIRIVIVHEDITERKQAEIKLQKSKDTLQDIVENMPTRIFWKDRDSAYLGCNTKFAKDAGYFKPDELIGKTDFDMGWEQQAKLYRMDDEMVMASGNPKLDYEEPQTNPDGKVIWLKSSKMPLRDENEKVIGLLGIYEDFSAQKQAEEDLIKAGALQDAIFNSANFSSIATDAHGVIQIFNVGAERMLGYSAEDVLNKITPADISDPQEVIARARILSLELTTLITPGFEALVFKASRGIEDIYELTYIRKDGSRFPAVVSVTALRDAQNTIIGYLLIGTDNTARKQIEAEQKQLGQALRDQQFYTRSLFESNIDALVTTDPSGIITDVNKQMEALTDCTRDELIGAPFKRYFTDPELAETGINLVLTQKKVTNYELTARTRSGRETVVSYNATTFYDRDRKLQGVFVAARDITERNRVDLVLQEKNVELEIARSVAEKALLAKSEFLSSMSHELRSPLNAILGFAQLMETDSPAPTPIQMQSVDQISKAGWHLLNLINEVLDLSKIESGHIPISPEPVALSEVLIECMTMLEPLAQQQGVNLNMPSLEIPNFIHADRIRVKQVIINLLSNAIKYNTEQGTVNVSCSESAPGRIRMSIKDTGPGLTPDQLAHLFQAFNRLGQETGDVEGTGIGLVVAKQLVELMGGVIGVESTIGKGSTFWFELLAVDEPHLSREDGRALALAITETELINPPQLRTILYIEDNPANLKLIEKIIARHPFLELLTARNGTRGCKIANDSHPDLILMDINLPDINGYQTLQILRENPSTQHIPVLALSANATQRDIQKGLQAGFFRYLTKPIRIHELMKAVTDAFDLGKNQPDDNDRVLNLK